MWKRLLSFHSVFTTTIFFQYDNNITHLNDFPIQRVLKYHMALNRVKFEQPWLTD
jgi:hypothetical protein